MSEASQYVYFFVIYTVVNAVFYTASSIAYSTLSMLVTANKHERVQLGAARFIFTMLSGVFIGTATVGLVSNFGGGMVGWRMVAIIYSALFAIILLICVLSVKELPASELNKFNDTQEKEQPKLLKSIGYIFRNKFYVMQLFINIFFNMTIVTSSAVGIFYMTYILDNPAMLGLFAVAQAIPMVIGLSLAPVLVKKWNIYKANLYGMIIAVSCGIPYAIFGLNAMVVPMMICLAICAVGRGPLVANNQALIAEISEYSLQRDGIRLEGSMYSCTSMGMKIGGGMGTAITGWLLSAANYDGMADTQPESAQLMIKCLYVVLPLIIAVIMTLLQSRLKVEEANAALKDVGSPEPTTIK
jgi:GPH family glycoside/pentoside/hexuronide:cation symporter